MTEARPPASPEPGALVLDDLVPVRRSETEVYRGNQRTPLISIYAPATAILNARATQRLRQTAAQRGLGTTRPNRLEIRFSQSTNLLVAVPHLVIETDAEPDDEDLFEVRWVPDANRAVVNLIEFLQPRNMMVPPGRVMEVPVELRTVAGIGPALVVDFSAPVYREVRSEDAIDQAAAGSQAAG